MVEKVTRGYSSGFGRQIMLPEESKEMNREGQMVKKDDSGASSGSTIPLILMQILMQFAHAVMHWHM